MFMTSKEGRGGMYRIKGNISFLTPSNKLLPRCVPRIGREMVEGIETIYRHYIAMISSIDCLLEKNINIEKRKKGKNGKIEKGDNREKIDPIKNHRAVYNRSLTL